MQDIYERARKIRVAIFDVDGVLTDGALYYTDTGEEMKAFSELLGRCSTGAQACAYVGDDLVDLPVMKRCGLAVAVPDAPALVRRQAQYVTRARGGHGAAREFCEIILHAQGSLAARLADYGDK